MAPNQAAESHVWLVDTPCSLRESLGDKPYYAHLGHHLTGAGTLIPSMVDDHECTATRTATGLVQASTQWTSSLARSTENRLNKHNFRTHKDGLERAQANS